MKKLIYFLLLVFFSNTSIAQQGNIKFGHLSLKDGLSQSDVLTIIQTKNGLLWFGTQDGLNSYNGFEFKVVSADSRRIQVLQLTIPKNHIVNGKQSD